MSAPPPTSPPPGPPWPPPGPPPPYGPPYYPYPYYPKPPKRDTTVLIIVLVILLVVLVPIISAALLYIMVSGLLQTPPDQTHVTFGSVDQTGGNATVAVVSSSRQIDPSELRLILEANTSASASFPLPAPDGSVRVVVGGVPFRVFWLDSFQNAEFGAGDALWITGDLAPLPSAWNFAVDLLDVQGAIIARAPWTTV